ncbi:MAG: MFS transporter [Candidatus Nanopelagicales bacterium]
MRRHVTLLDDVPQEVRRVLWGIMLNAAGGGLTLSLLMVYLTTIRNISAATSGLVLAWEAVVGLAVTPVVGSLIDRLGPVRLMLPGIVLQALGVAAWSMVHTPLQAFAVATYTSVTGTTIWPAQSTLLAQLTRPEQRDRTFGLSFMFLNLGFGVGGLVSALIVRDGDAPRFELMYRIDGFTYLALAIAVWSVRRHAHALHAAIDRTHDRGGYADVLRDRRVWIMMLGGIVMFTCGYGALNSGVPLFATTEAHLSVRWLGLIFGANTFVIVALQPRVIRWVRGRSRTSMLSLVGVLWAVSWVILGTSTLLLPALLLMLGQAVFAAGETLWAPVGPTLVNAMAPDALRGRYNAVIGLQWGLSGVAGPAITGSMLGHGLGTAWWITMAAGTLLGSALMLLLRRELDPVTDGRVAESTHD